MICITVFVLGRHAVVRELVLGLIRGGGRDGVRHGVWDWVRDARVALIIPMRGGTQRIQQVWGVTAVSILGA